MLDRWESRALATQRWAAAEHVPARRRDAGRAPSLGAAVVTLGLIYVMLRPVGSNSILFPVLGAMGVASIALMVARRRTIAAPLVPSALLFTTVAALGLVVGADNPGWLMSLLPWVVGPLIFGCWAASMDAHGLRLALAACAWATTALSTFIVVYVAGQSGLLPVVIPPMVLEETGAGFDGSGAATAIRLYGLSTLAAASPMWIASLLVAPHPWLPSLPVRIAAASTSVAAVMLGGRRAIILVVLLTPLIVWLLRVLLARGPRGRIPLPAAVAALVGLPVSALLLPLVAAQPAVQRALQGALDFFEPDHSAAGIAVRSDQGRLLLDEAGTSPVVGHGFGAVLDSGFVRNAERPWEFELQYHMLAFQLGAVGIVLLCLVVLTALSALRLAARAEPAAMPVLVVTATAAIGMLVANASNPYLQAPGHMWSIALVLGAVNHVLLRGAAAGPVGRGPARASGAASAARGRRSLG